MFTYQMYGFLFKYIVLFVYLFSKTSKMSYTLLQELIPHLEEYSKTASPDSMEGFLVWLNNKMFGAKGETDHKDHLEVMIGFQIIMLNKEVKRQTKSIISKSTLSSLDGYSFLLHLENGNSFRKMELIEMHKLEAPTGFEIIKRLLSKDLIEEFDDENDRRAKRVRLTKKGEAELNALKPQIDAAFAKFSEKLEMDEKLSLVGTMSKLISD